VRWAEDEDGDLCNLPSLAGPEPRRSGAFFRWSVAERARGGDELGDESTMTARGLWSRFQASGLAASSRTRVEPASSTQRRGEMVPMAQSAAPSSRLGARADLVARPTFATASTCAVADSWTFRG